MDELQKKYNLLVTQNEILRKENTELRSLLCAHGIEYKSRPTNVIDSIYSPISLPVIKLSLDERVALFMSLFKGRKDVFARRWFSKSTGKAGYQPVCVNEWRRGVCDKKTYKCAECPNRDFAPLTSHDVYRHWEVRMKTAVTWSGFMPSCLTIIVHFYVRTLMTRAVSMTTRIMFLLLWVYVETGRFHTQLNVLALVTVPMFGYSLKNHSPHSRQGDWEMQYLQRR